MTKLTHKNNTFTLTDNNNIIIIKTKPMYDKRLHEGAGGYVLKLPENSQNAKYITLPENYQDKEFELEIQPGKVTNINKNNINKNNINKSWYDYATDEEKEILNNIKSKCLERINQEIIKQKSEELKAKFTEIAELMHISLEDAVKLFINK